VGAVGLAALGLYLLPDWDFGSIGLPSGENGETITVDPTEDDDVEPAPRFDGVPVDPSLNEDATGESGVADGGPMDDSAADDPAEGVPMSMVDVLVDGGEYWVLQRYASDGLPVREPMTLSGVLGLVGQVPGTEDGLKIRVARTPNAIAGAVDDLMEAVRNTLEDDAIDYRTRLVEDAAPGYPGEGGFDGGSPPSAL
jgi:hypothetical protein